MEQFKASDQDWETVKKLAGCSGNSYNYARTIHELRDRVAALEEQLTQFVPGVLVTADAPEPTADGFTAVGVGHAVQAGAVEALRELVEAMHEAFFGNDAGLPPQVIQAVNSAHLFLTVHPTPEAAAAMGAQGGPPSEAERLAFEAWMRGHSWPVAGVWDGTTYTGRPDLEPLWLDTAAMQTRMLWAAWRDRAALATLPAAPEPEPSPSPAAGDRRLLEVVADFIGLHPVQEGKARAVILAVAKWLRSVGNHGSAAELEREASR